MRNVYGEVTISKARFDALIAQRDELWDACQAVFMGSLPKGNSFIIAKRPMDLIATAIAKGKKT